MKLKPILIRGTFLGLLVVVAAGLGQRTQAEDTIIELPVSFDVVNTNTSGVPCASDGLAYTVRGHITGPQSALLSADPGAIRVITVYLYGQDSGEWDWRFSAVPGYNWPADMAQAGHISLTIDMLGYGDSGHPHGLLVCLGSQADVSHQIVDQLRRGTYTVLDGTSTIKFSKVIVAGHDLGGTVAQIQAYSYRDLDGLIVSGWADQGGSQYIITLAAQTIATECATGGQNPHDETPGGGYHFMALDSPEIRAPLFVDMDPAVLEAVLALAHKNPCGHLMSAPEALAIDRVRLREVDAPVLLLYSNSDAVFPPSAGQQQRANFCDECDVETVFAGTGHWQMLERSAADVLKAASDWLCSRGFVSGGVGCGTPGKATGGGQIDPSTGEPAVNPLTGEPLELATMLLHTGSASTGTGSQANFGFVVQYASGDLGPAGNLRYKDSAAGVEVKATSLQTFLIADGSCGANSHARITGVATVNDTPNQQFAVEVDDCGTPGATDTFTISLPGQSYEASGVLMGGNIKVSP